MLERLVPTIAVVVAAASTMPVGGACIAAVAASYCGLCLRPINEDPFVGAVVMVVALLVLVIDSTMVFAGTAPFVAVVAAMVLIALVGGACNDAIAELPPKYHRNPFASAVVVVLTSMTLVINSSLVFQETVLTADVVVAVVFTTLIGVAHGAAEDESSSTYSSCHNFNCIYSTGIGT